VIGLHGVGRQVKPGQALVLFAALCVSAALCRAASGAEAFITDQTGDEVSVLDLGTKHVVARIPVTGKPAGIAMARDGARLRHKSGRQICLGDRHCVAQDHREIAIPDTPLGIAADPSGGFIYVAGFYQPRLYKIDLAAAAIVATSRLAHLPPASLCRLMGR